MFLYDSKSNLIPNCRLQYTGMCYTAMSRLRAFSFVSALCSVLGVNSPLLSQNNASFPLYTHIFMIWNTKGLYHCQIQKKNASVFADCNSFSRRFVPEVLLYLQLIETQVKSCKLKQKLTKINKRHKVSAHCSQTWTGSFCKIDYATLFLWGSAVLAFSFSI